MEDTIFSFLYVIFIPPICEKGESNEHDKYYYAYSRRVPIVIGYEGVFIGIGNDGVDMGTCLRPCLKHHQVYDIEGLEGSEYGYYYRGYYELAGL